MCLLVVLRVAVARGVGLWKCSALLVRVIGREQVGWSIEVLFGNRILFFFSFLNRNIN